MDIQAFNDALNSPNDVKLNPEWTANVLQSLDVDVDDPASLAKFEQFLNYIVENHKNETIDVTQFYNWWVSFEPMDGGGGSNDLNTYQRIYDTFFPGTPDEFAESYAEFIFRTFSAGEDVTPSEMLSVWFDWNATYYLTDPTLVDESSLAEGDYDKPQIMLLVYKIIITMIEDLQVLATAQVDRLEFFSAYQRAYTDLMEKIPQFLPGRPVLNVFTGEWFYVNDDWPNAPDDVDPQIHPANADSLNAEQEDDLKKNDRKHIEGDRELRLDLSAINSKYLENLRSFRSGVTSDAQAHQTNFAQTNEAVNQQVNMAADIIRQLQQLVESINQKNN